MNAGENELQKTSLALVINAVRHATPTPIAPSKAVTFSFFNANNVNQ